MGFFARLTPGVLGQGNRARREERMFDSLATHMAELDADRMDELSLEDVALCSAWHTSNRDRPKIREMAAGLPEAIELWVEHIPGDTVETEGRRQQPVLREVMGLLLDGRLGAMRRSQLDFLCTAQDLIERAAAPEPLDRVRQLLEPHRRDMRARRKALPLAPGLPDLSKTTGVAVTADLLAAPVRMIKFFAGIELPCRGPVFTHDGDLKIVGEIPDECIVVVDQGSCTVSGYVMGKLAARHNCEVRDNISGVVVVREGRIRTRNILGRALVVSKAGDVACRDAQAPELVFGGARVSIAEASIAGVFVGRRIDVGGEADGGRFEASETLTAKRLRHSERRPLSVVLRSHLSCEDYGAIVEPEARRLLSRAARFQRQLDSVKQMIQASEFESEQLATNAVLYLCAGKDVRARIEASDVARRRLAALNRIIAGYAALSATVEEDMVAFGRKGSRAAEPASTDPQDGSALSELDAELRQLASDGALDPDLSAEYEEMVGMNATLESKKRDRKLVSSIFLRLQDKVGGWIDERKRLLEQVQRTEQELGKVLEAANAAGKGSKPVLLKKLIDAARQRGAGDPLFERASSPFVRTMVRTLGTRAERLRAHREKADAIRHELRAVNDQLRTEFLMVSPFDNPDGVTRPQVTARFTGGCRICTDAFLLEDPELPPGLVVDTPNSGSATKTYAREGQRIVEVS